MFCNSGFCSNNSTNFNRYACSSCGCNSCGNSRNGRNSCGCNSCNSCNSRSNSCGCNSCSNSCGCNSRSNSCGCSCGCSRTNYGCGWYCCPGNGNSGGSTVPTPIPTPTPIVNLSHFTAASATTAAGAVIPLTLARQVGTQITSSGAGALLQPGTYEISFALTGTSATTGTSTVGAQLNGVTIPAFSQSASVTATGSLYNLAGVGTIAVTAANSILNLVNFGANSQDFTDVNLVVRKIA